MKIRQLFLIMVIVSIGMPLAAQSLPPPPEIAARSYMLLDLTANQILASKDLDNPVEPASLTKLMTAYLVFDALRQKKISLRQPLAVSDRAWKMTGSRMFIDPKMKVPVEDLIKGMIVQSGNDATIALAEGVGGTVERFVELMNAQAKSLGMKSTSYRNPEGLTQAGHTTSARDLGTLAARLIHDFPDEIVYFAIKKYHYAGTPASNDINRNLLLFRDPSVDGLKTGHTDAAGYCLIATAKRNFPNLVTKGAPAGSIESLGGRRLLSIVLGASSENARANESQKLLNWGYTAFDAVKLFDTRQTVVAPNVWQGKSDVVKLGSPKNVVVAVPAGGASKIKVLVVRPDPLIAPLSRGQKVGHIKVTYADKDWVEIPLLALETVEQAGAIGRAWDAIRLWVK